MFGCFAKAGGNKMSRPTPETDCESGFFDMETAVGAAFARRLERERDEAREQLQRLRVQLNHYTQANEMAEQAFRERDDAREEIENLKLQLGLWEDGNIICEETLGEIRLLKEQIDRVLLERNEAHKIANRAIDDLAWFNETNAQRLRAELDQLKEDAK
jgi:chromosome segregation ATPase